MKEISVILKEMESSMIEIKDSFDHRELVVYLKKYEKNRANGDGKTAGAYERYITTKFNIVKSSLMFNYGSRMKDIFEGEGKKSSRKMHTEIKNLMDCFMDYVKPNMPEWYRLAEESGKIKDIKSETQRSMELV